MEKITITNPYGDSLTFEQGASGYMLISRGSFGGVQVLNSEEMGYLQRGSSLSQKKYASKAWPIVLGIKGVNSDDLRSRLSNVEKLFDAEYNTRADLTPFTVKFEKTGYVPKVAKCYLSSSVDISNSQENNRGSYQRLFVSFWMPEPIWQDENYTEILLENVINSFEFAIDITDTFEFGEIQAEGVDVIYDGRLPASLIIEFQGLATNPLLENVTYGESLKLLTTIASGSSAIINTDYNNPQVEIDGVDSFSYIDSSNSDLDMLLRRGVNNIKLSTDDTSPAVAKIKFKKTYLTPLGDLS